MLHDLHSFRINCTVPLRTHPAESAIRSRYIRLVLAWKGHYIVQSCRGVVKTLELTCQGKEALRRGHLCNVQGRQYMRRTCAG